MGAMIENRAPQAHAREVAACDLREYAISHLGEAVDEGWIRPYYQPVIRTVTGRLCGMEALARWEDPLHGLIVPDAFIPALEDARLIHELDSCIIRQVCRQYREAVDAGLPTVPVSFNLSRLDFDLCNMHDVIEQAVQEHEVPRSMLNIEITESVFGTDPAFMATTISKFHEVGFQVWMDDFGSAYSSLNVLKDFEFDEMKIDMAFLSQFGEKSRTIIASVVDMAKRLGIQTLAEGVETTEHSVFLRHIGCEKQQGFLYGKPQPMSPAYIAELDRTIGFERHDERRYYRTIGSVNTLSLSERDFMPDNMTKDYVTSMPLAFVEYAQGRFSILDCNDTFVENLQNIGIADLHVAERMINDTSRLPARTARRLVGKIDKTEFARHDYVSSGIPCIMRAKHIATNGERTTILVTLDSAAGMLEKQRRERLEEALEALFTIYEHVDILHLDEGYSEPVFTQAAFKQVYDVPDLADAVRQFTENEIFPHDRGRYAEFMDVDTMIERLEASGQGFLTGFFRVHDTGGDYTWKLFTLIRLTAQPGNKVMACVRDTNWDNDALLQAAFDDDEELAGGFDAADLRITDSSLWRSLTDDRQIGVFWKNSERQFVGCNQAFLDYYGFDSASAIIGKTDEDMGWHVNPVPYMHDEQRVIHEGATTRNVPGHCIVKGEIRDIVSSKRPIYRNGKIVGLVGYFIDVTSTQPVGQKLNMVPYTDSVTGALNYSGLDASTGHYIESYERLGIDFAMLMIDIDDFRQTNRQFGYEFGDKALRVAAESIRETVGPDCIVGHIYADRFVVLRQHASCDDMDGLGHDIAKALGAIKEVDGNRLTIFIHFAAVRYSETEDIEEFKRLGRERLGKAKHAHAAASARQTLTPPR